MARSGGTYLYNPETDREDLVKDSQTAMPSIAERREAREAAAAPAAVSSQPKRKTPPGRRDPVEKE